MPVPTTVDVLIPTYNPGAEHLRVALDALCAQTYTQWQAYIHDESDAVNVEEIVRPYLKDPRFRFQKSPKRLGIGGNWNACLTNTRSSVVAYLFHDDEWVPQYLERAVAVLEKHPNVGLVAMDHEYRIEGDFEGAISYIGLERWRRRLLNPGVIDGKEFLRRWFRDGIWPNLIGEPSFCVLRRSVVDQVGLWNEQMPQSLDAEYWVRMLPLCDWYYVADHCGYFRVHDEGTTARNRREGKGLFDRFRILEDIASRVTSASERAIAVQVQGRQFQLMFARFAEKYLKGDRLSSSGSGAVKRFALRHPWIVLRALTRALFGRGEERRGQSKEDLEQDYSLFPAA
jgi:glycosyltransferase involved in cell wall biosynthesis